MSDKKLMMSSSPHITATHSTRSIMRDVLIALAPALAAGIYFFGLRSLVVVLLSVASCMLSELLFTALRKKPRTLSDLSAAVTGVILGLNLSPLVPFYVPVFGGVFAMLIVKMPFGGLGKNFANPAAAARVFLLLSFSTAMGRFMNPVDWTGAGAIFTGMGGADAVTGATPLVTGDASYLNLFLGNVGGCIGETSALALLLGGLYLLIRRVIHWRVPVLVLLSGAVFSALFAWDLSASLYTVLSGGFMLGAIFMATDYATSPNTVWGSVIYAVFIGFVAVLLRSFTNMPEGISFAILLGNLITPLLDKYIYPRPFGYQKKGKEGAKNA